MKSGIFEDNYYTLNSVDGQQAWLGGYQDRYDNNPHNDGIGAPRLGLPDRFDSMGGDGGNAPRSTEGGVGYKYFFSGKPIPAQDGGFPGGGGGGGYTLEMAVYGHGASGLVLIQY
ncbi:MAG: hypothetical protein R2783_06395 [Gelidibacter sp.]